MDGEYLGEYLMFLWRCIFFPEVLGSVLKLMQVVFVTIQMPQLNYLLLTFKKTMLFRILHLCCYYF